MNEHIARTDVGVHLLWAFCHPHLAQKAIDDLFEKWGNKATYSLNPFALGEVRLTAIIHKGDERTPMFEVMSQKHNMEVELAMAVEEFSTAQRQRPNGTWVWEQHDKERAKNMKLMQEAA